MSGLDPKDWTALRALSHRMLDDVFDRAEHMGEGPVWQPMPQEARDAFRHDLPQEGEAAELLYSRFLGQIRPYSNGNTHPGFMGWVQGAGTPIGILAELLAASLNDNCGGRDHAAIEVERQVIRWAAEMVGMPVDSSGCLVTGSSLANFIGIITASRAADPGLRAGGVGQSKLIGYAAETAHGCVSRAFDLAGLGSDALRLIPVDELYRMDSAALAARIRQDRQAGYAPFIIVGTAGSVDCGAVDPLDELAAIARAEKCWFHVDGAFGAFARLSPEHAIMLDGIEQADSLALDFHKWGQVPYDAGCVLVRDRALHAQAFAQSLSYLTRADRGLAGNAPWPCDFGPDLSRGFRALKVWMTIAHYGARRLGEMVAECCAVARYLAERVEADARYLLMAPVALNIVCFTLADRDDAAIDELVKDLHESGVAAPSTTRIEGRMVIRAAIVNHRTTRKTIDAMLSKIERLACI
ncbi:pyridoxal phosphate-dependent decarboxylase family protein [Asaia krungthepensis]|uniref:Aromatic-L-amino-acid decarboxylase n=1 Tax=Asaia krungthepensis NRIC 0535 TaxID=1307925 RepID=A0ABQ0Q1I4_9PROT|nr:pyridoxal-dependent decarboxylase [Asaia krungthepensis]GBQ86911.1 aromatic-L-amino-acid decarboxylase [Asaia krungthepensis NRIC 0535]